MPRRLVLLLAYVQLVLSLALGAMVVYLYSTYASPFREAIRSTAVALANVSNAIGNAAATIEATGSLFPPVAEGLRSAATQISQLEQQASVQARAAPQYAVGLRSTSKLLLDLADTLNAIVGHMNFEVLSGVELQGLKPVYTTSRPLAAPAKDLQQRAGQVKEAGTALATAAASLPGVAQSLETAIAETSRHSKQVISELEKTILVVSSQDLPKVLIALRNTATSVQSLSKTLDAVQSLDTWLLTVGLLVSLWCLLNSLTSVSLARRLPASMSRSHVGRSS